MDRISSLPDSIICKILSYLPIKEAVSTSILSRGWRHLWKDLQVFVFDDVDAPLRWSPEYQSEELDDRFDSIVNAILAQRNAHAYPIEKFSLTCYSSEETISTWLEAVIGPCLQELYLHLNVKLPEGIFTCASLKSLVLKGYIDLFDGHEVSNVYLPSLKNLELQIRSANINQLLSGCPAIENLNLHLGTFFFCIPKLQMPYTLKSLTFSETIADYDATEEISVREIYTPSLEYLNLSIQNYSKEAAIHVSVINFPNMVEAHLSIYEGTENVNWVLELLQALSETKLLALKESTTQCLFRAPGFEFPAFRRLLNLEIDVPPFNKSFLLNLLHNCPVLERLAVIIFPFGTLGLKYNGPTPPTMVPNCLTSRLNSFEYTIYRYSADEHEFIAYVLQRGLVLKTVTIHFKDKHNQVNKDDVVMKLSAIPRGSTICQLNFI